MSDSANQQHQPPNKPDDTFIFVIGKILTFEGKSYGMCYYMYDTWLNVLLTPKLMTNVKTASNESKEQSVFKRGFTLPNLTLLRCNLFSTLLAAEFASLVVNTQKEHGLPASPVLVLKHRGTLDLLTDHKVNMLASSGSTNWTKAPLHVRQNKQLLIKIIKKLVKNNIRITCVDASKNLDGDLEFYVNCDKDPMDKVNDCPEGSQEFQNMMRIAKQHKTGMMDLLDIGVCSPGTRTRKPTKNETKISTSCAKTHNKKRTHPKKPPQAQQPIPKTPEPDKPKPEPQPKRLQTHAVDETRILQCADDIVCCASISEANETLLNQLVEK